MRDVKWTEEFRIHLEDAAIQHRRLEKLIDILLRAIEDGCTARRIQAAFGDVLCYAELHFSDEEEFMKRAGYPQPLRERHAQVHRGVLEKLRDTRTEFEASGVLDPQLPSKLRDWLRAEEAEEDKRYLDYFCAWAGI